MTTVAEVLGLCPHGMTARFCRPCQIEAAKERAKRLHPSSKGQR